MQKVRSLIDKYWKGDSTPEEERFLKEHFTREEGYDENEQLLFAYLNEKSREAIDEEDFDQNILNKVKEGKTFHFSIRRIKVWQVAAAILVLFAIGTILRYEKPQPVHEAVITDTYEDPEKAFEETKKALMLISEKMNTGHEYAFKLSKFNESQELIKEKQK